MTIDVMQRLKNRDRFRLERRSKSDLMSERLKNRERGWVREKEHERRDAETEELQRAV